MLLINQAGGETDLLKLDGVTDLAEFELNSRVLRVAVGMILGKDGECLILAVLGNEVARRLGDPWKMDIMSAGYFQQKSSRRIRRLTPQDNQLDETRHALEDSREAPLPLALGHILESKAEPVHDDGAAVPQAVVDGREAGSVLGVANLRDEHGRGDLCERVAEADDGTTASKGAVVLCSSLEGSSHSHDYETKSDARTSAPAVADDRHERDRNDGSDLIEGAQKAEQMVTRVVEKAPPAAEGLHVVEVHARDSVRPCTACMGSEASFAGHLLVVTRSHGREAKNSRVEDKLPNARFPVPGDALKLRSFLAGLLGHRAGLAETHLLLETHVDCRWQVGDGNQRNEDEDQKTDDQEGEESP